MRKYGWPEEYMFVVAYSWMFDETASKAKEIYWDKKQNGKQSYIDKLITVYCRNFRIAFQAD